MTTKKEILKAIRKNCLDCCCGSRNEVANCHIEKCPLNPFRMGTDPKPARSTQVPITHPVEEGFAPKKKNGGVEVLALC